MPPLLDIERLAVSYGEQVVLANISLTLARGDIGCLLGPSGCGKTSLLRAIAGFQPVAHGSITVDGRMVSRPRATLPPEQRQVGMVFQDLALFPHLTVGGNIGFGLERRPRAERQQRIAELLELVGLPGHERSYPHELSGGQQQRVALARALAPRPPLLLLDEPFSGLDVELREDLARDVRAILRQAGATAILVTHDQQEAFAFADIVGMLHGGSLLQWDTPYNLYHRPANRVVAGFVGAGRFVCGRVVSTTQVDTPLGLLGTGAPLGLTEGTLVDVLIRPDDLVHVAGAETSLSATVTACNFRGAEYLYTVRLETGEELLCLTPSHDVQPLGAVISLRPAPNHLVVFPIEAAPSAA